MSTTKQIFIDFQNSSTHTNVPTQEQFQSWVEAAIEDELQIAEVSIVVVNIDEMTKLNHQYRHKNEPTNVLSFPAQIPPELNLNLLGDIVICAPVVEKEALEQQKQTLHHWAHLTIHGTLHLLGYDHENSADAEVMENLEITIMSRLGFPNPYTIEMEINE